VRHSNALLADALEALLPEKRRTIKLDERSV
jgi:hypothetical protein